METVKGSIDPWGNKTRREEAVDGVIPFEWVAKLEFFFFPVFKLF